jgi:nucleotide-binding universal stress UspA family protein
MQYGWHMPSAQHRFRIVAALDRSEYAEIVLEHAIDQAARHDAPDMHFLTVISTDDDPELAKVWLATQVLQGLETLGAAASDWRSRLHVTCGVPAEEIANLAATLRADLMVIGRFGIHERTGSIADSVLALATCPTLVVGLTDRSFERQEQCAKCVAVREESDGERWFCDEHASPGRSHFTALIPSTGIGGGSLMW